MRIEVVAAIVGMALVTYATRAGGLYLAGRLSPSPRIEAWLRHIPGAVLVALVAPAALGSGAREALALVATAVVAARTGNLFAAMVTGVGMVFLLRTPF